MEAVLSGTGKKFRTKWVFRNLNFCFRPGERHALTGQNGSGKSTLLLMLAAYLSPSAGSIAWQLDGRPIAADLVYRHLSYASPAMELVEEFTVEEMIRFHNRLKPARQGLGLGDLMDLSELQEHKDIRIDQLSSGQRQRLKILLAITTQSRLLLLDEPCTNLDARGTSWYAHLLDSFAKDTTTVIASNQHPGEYPNTRHILEL